VDEIKEDAMSELESKFRMRRLKLLVEKHSGRFPLVRLSEVRNRFSATYDRAEIDEAITQLSVEGVLSVEDRDGLACVVAKEPAAK
jgi:hypothetical protein